MKNSSFLRDGRYGIYLSHLLLFFLALSPVFGQNNTTGTTSDWTLNSTWSLGAPPTIGQVVNINHPVTNVPTTLSLGTTTVGTAGNFPLPSTSLTISAGSGLAVNGAGVVTPGSGTLIFAGAGTLSGTGAIALNNLTSGGNLTVTTAPTIAGTFTIAGGHSVSAAPIYQTGSTLLYATGGTRTLGGSNLEWTSTATTGSAGLGRPHHVTVSTTTTLTGPATALGLAGTLNVNATRIFNTASNQSLYIGGDLTVGGTLALAGTGILSFYGSNTQNITGAGTLTIQLFEINKSGGSLLLGRAVSISAISGNIFTMVAGGTNSLDLGGNTFTLPGTGGTINIGATGTHTITNSVGTGTFQNGTFARSFNNAIRLSSSSTSTTLQLNGNSTGTGLSFTNTGHLITGGNVQVGTGIVTANSGATVNVQNGANLLVTTGGTFTATAGSNTVVVNSGGTVLNTGGTINGVFATLVFQSSSFYKHRQNSGAVPTANWNSGSTVSLEPTASATITGLGQSFSNFQIDHDVTGPLVIATTNATMAVGGTFTVQNTTGVNTAGTILFNSGTASTVTVTGATSVQGKVSFRFNSGGAGVTLNANGGFNIVNSTSDVKLTTGAGAGTLSTTNFTQTNGSFDLGTGAGAGTLTVSGNLTQSAGTFTRTGSVACNLNLTGSGTQTISLAGALAASVTNNLNITINKSGGNPFDLPSQITTCNVLTITLGGIRLNGDLTTVGNVTNSADPAGRIDFGSVARIFQVNGTFNSTRIVDMSGGSAAHQLKFNGATITFSGTFTPGSGTIEYMGGNAQTVASLTYNNLRISNNTASSVTKTLAAGTTTVGGTLRVERDGSATVTLALVGSSINVTGLTTVGIGGIVTNATGGGTNTFGDITVSGAASNWTNAANDVYTINGSLTVNSGGSGFTSGTGTYTFAGTGKTIGGTLAITISSMLITGSYTNLNAAGLTTTATLTINPGGSFTNGDGVVGAILNLNSTTATAITNNGTIDFSPVNNFVVYGAANAQNILATTYHHLRLQGGNVTKTALGNTTVNGNLNLNSTTTTLALTTITLGVSGNIFATDGTIGAFTFTTGTINVAGNIGIVAGTGQLNITASGAGILNLTGNWTSLGTLVPSTSTVNYLGSAQTVKSTTYNIVNLSGSGIKDFPASGTLVAVDINIGTGCSLNLGLNANLTINNTISGTGNITTTTKAGTLQIGNTSTSNMNPVGTLRFGSPAAFTNISFRKPFNFNVAYTIPASASLGNTAGATLCTINNDVVTDAVTVDANTGNTILANGVTLTVNNFLAGGNTGRFFALGTGSKVKFTQSALVALATTVNFATGIDYNSTLASDLQLAFAAGTLNGGAAQTSVATDITMTSGSFTFIPIHSTGSGRLPQNFTSYESEIQVGAPLWVHLSGVPTNVGTVRSVSNSGLVVEASVTTTIPGFSRYYATKLYRPVQLVTTVATGTSPAVTISYRKHSGSGPTANGNYVPDNANNRRTQLIVGIETLNWASSNTRISGDVSDDFNNAVTTSDVAIFKWNGILWAKLRPDATGSVLLNGNFTFTRNAVPYIDDNHSFILGTSGGELPDDPTYTWNGSASTDWNTAANWSRDPLSAPPVPNDVSHVVRINSTGHPTRNPVINSGTFSVFQLDHIARSLTVESGATLRIYGNYNYNINNSLIAGTGTISRTGGTAVSGDIDVDFVADNITPGTILYRTNGGVIGVVESRTNSKNLVLTTFGGSIPEDLGGVSFNFFRPVYSSISSITTTTGSVQVSGSGFSDSWRGRTIRDGSGAFVGVVSVVDPSGTLLYLHNTVATGATIATPQLGSGTTTTGSAMVDFKDGSTVAYSGSVDQNMAPVSYSNLTIEDGRTSLTIPNDYMRFVAVTGASVTIRSSGTLQGKFHIKPTPVTGPKFVFAANSKFLNICPSYTVGSAGGTFRNFAPGGTLNSVPVVWGPGATDYVDYELQIVSNTNMAWNEVERTIGTKLRNLTISGFTANSILTVPSNANALTYPFIVHGTTTLNELPSGTGGTRLQFGSDSAVNIPVTFLGPIVGANKIVAGFNGGAGIYQKPILTIGGTGAITGGDFFTGFYTSDANLRPLRPRLTSLTVNRPGAVFTLQSGVNGNLVTKGDLLVSSGTLNQTGANFISALGTLTVGGTGIINHSGGSALGGAIVAQNIVVNAGGQLIKSGSSFAGISSTSSITVNGGLFDASGTTFGASMTSLSGSNPYPTGAYLSGNGDIFVNGGTLKLSSSVNDTLNGNLVVSGGTVQKLGGGLGILGNINQTGGTINFSGARIRTRGSSAQTFNFGANANTFNSLLVGKTGGSVDVTGGKLNITDIIDFSSTLPTNVATIGVTAPGEIVLKSTDTKTASIGPVTGGISGNRWTMERYVGGVGSAPGWYLAGTPIKGQTLGDWSDDTRIFTLTGPCGLGFIGNTSTANVFNFDGTAAPVGPNPDVEQNGWRLSDCNLPHGVGKRIYFGSSFFVSARVLDNTGEMNSGPFSFSVPYNAAGYGGLGWSLVANPYPSSIRWSGPGWTKTNMFGDYVGWNGTLSAYGACNASGIGSAPWITDTIASSQAFFVRSNAVGAVLNATEAVKKTPSNRSFLREAVYSNLLRMKVASSDNQKADYLVIMFHSDASEGYDNQWDAGKFTNPFINLSSRGADLDLAINAFADLNEDRVIPLTLTVYQPGSYRFSFTGLESFDAGTQMYLRDNYLGEISPITEGSVQNIEINGDAGSQGADRFEIVFSPQNLTQNQVSKGFEKFKVAVVPNPGSGRNINIVLKNHASHQTHIYLTDMVGKVILDEDFVSSGNQLTIPSIYVSGVYQMVITNGGQTSVQKVVVQ